MDFSARFQKSSHRFTQIALFIGIVVVLNFLSFQHFFRLDFSEGKQYSLSDASKRMLKNLDDVVTIKVYFSEDLPSNLAVLARHVRDFLDEYRAFGGSHIQVHYIDPVSDPKYQSEVQSLGIPQIQMQVIEKDSVQVKQGYLGMGIFFADKNEVIPVVGSLSSLEYELTSGMKKVIASNLKKVGFLSGHDEHSIIELPVQAEGSTQGDYTEVKKALEGNYEVVTTEIKDGKLTTAVDTLVVAGPKKALASHELVAIDQFLLNGGNIVFLIDRIGLAGFALEATTVESGLEEFLNHLGVTVEQNAVLDLSNAQASFRQEFIQWIVNYPLWPKLLPETFLLSNPILARLESVVLPWSSSLTVRKDAFREDADKSQSKSNKPKLEMLIKTNESSWTQVAPFNFSPEITPEPPDGKFQSLVMAVFFSGEFESFFKGKPVPVAAAPEGQETSSLAPTIIEKSSKPGKVILVGDSDFTADNFAQQFPQNFKFFLNVVDFLTLDADLITIRSKQLVDRPIREISNAQRIAAKGIVTWAMPVLLSLYAIVRIYRRKAKKSLQQ